MSAAESLVRVGPTPNGAPPSGAPQSHPARPSRLPLTAKVDGRRSAIRCLRAGEAGVMDVAAEAYLARSPDYAMGMMAGYRAAGEYLYQNRSAWARLRQLVAP